MVIEIKSAVRQRRGSEWTRTHEQPYEIELSSVACMPTAPLPAFYCVCSTNSMLVDCNSSKTQWTEGTSSAYCGADYRCASSEKKTFVAFPVIVEILQNSGSGFIHREIQWSISHVKLSVETPSDSCGIIHEISVEFPRSSMEIPWSIAVSTWNRGWKCGRDPWIAIRSYFLVVKDRSDRHVNCHYCWSNAIYHKQKKATKADLTSVI